jgi:hypothetical protein
VIHDYKRHSTTTLLAAVDVKSSMIIGDCMPRHRDKEFLMFLHQIDRAIFKLLFTPTSASWMRLVERLFAEITTRRILRGSYPGIDEFEESIYDYLLLNNTKPKPFTWI